MDANATTPLSPEVFAAMRPWMLDTFGNASSIHYHGQRARAAVEMAREAVSRLLNCRAAEIVFTSGGTEGDNLAIFGLIGPATISSPRPSSTTPSSTPPNDSGTAASKSRFSPSTATASSIPATFAAPSGQIPGSSAS